jgi:hypothetical protein
MIAGAALATFLAACDPSEMTTGRTVIMPATSTTAEPDEPASAASGELKAVVAAWTAEHRYQSESCRDEQFTFKRRQDASFVVHCGNLFLWIEDGAVARSALVTTTSAGAEAEP